MSEDWNGKRQISVAGIISSAGKFALAPECGVVESIINVSALEVWLANQISFQLK
jgi:hypothetical protein